MKSWIDEQTGCKMCEADCVDEWLFDIWATGHNYDGASTVEDFKFLVKHQTLNTSIRKQEIVCWKVNYWYMVVQRRKKA